jgi:hypothetical protein
VTSHIVELEISESVTRGGVRRITWHVESDDDWISVTQLPGAELRDPASTAGVVWRRHVLVELAPGTRLMRVESEPERAPPPKDPMAYLWQMRGGVRRKVKRSYFRVGHQGRLVRVSEPTKHAPRRNGA